IDGVLADRTEMVVFYTAVNLLGNAPIFPRDAKFLDTQGNSLNTMIEYPSSKVNPGTPTNVQHGEFKLSFPKNDVPAHFNLSTKWCIPKASDEAHELIAIPIQLDASKYAGLEQRIKVNRLAKIGPYSLTVTDVILNTLSTRVYLQIECAEENFYQSLIDPVLW